MSSLLQIAGHYTAAGRWTAVYAACWLIVLLAFWVAGIR